MAPVVALTDKDTSFTGRSNIWALITEHSAQHPMLGTGYGAYWTPVPMPGGDSFEFVRRMGGFYPGSAHNGYLEILNDLGWVGLVLLLGFIAVFLLQALRQLRIDPPQAALYLAILLHQAITNLSETHWFGVLSVDFVIVCLCTTSLARAALQGSLRATHGVESFATGSGQPQPGAAR
jgi:O-antigen ligase